MNINEALNFFEGLLTQTDKKSESRVYEKFIGILADLKNRDLTEEQLQSIEEKLIELRLDEHPENRIKYLKRQLSKLIEYLKAEFSLITEGYYTALGTALGVAFGAAFGSIYDMGIGISFGIIIGLIIGASMDAKAKKQNRVLSTK